MQFKYIYCLKCNLNALNNSYVFFSFFTCYYNTPSGLYNKNLKIIFGLNYRCNLKCNYCLKDFSTPYYNAI